MKKLGIALLIIGAICIGSSLYIKGQVKEGQGKINSAQGNVDKGNSLFSLSPYTKDVGDVFTGSAQKEIDAGKMEVRHYEGIARSLMIGGILCLAGGVGLLLIRKRK